MNSCVLRNLLTWTPNKAESVCRKVGEYWGDRLYTLSLNIVEKKSDPIVPPKKLTDSYTWFLPEAQPYLNSMTRTPESKHFIIALAKHTLS